MYNKPGTKFAKRFTKFRPLRFPLLISVSTIIFVILILGFDKKKPISGLKKTTLDYPKFDPKVEILNGTEVIWQIPDSPKSVLFLAHGCNGKAANLFDKSLNCNHCIGLPEERLIVLEALSRKFAVIAVSSKRNCWSLTKEPLTVKKILKFWIQKQNLDNLPVVALGASSGGYFVSMLANFMNFSSIVVMIAEGVFDRVDITKSYPATLFVHMPKDKARKAMIDLNIEMMRKKGVDVGEVECAELKLSPGFLAERVPGLGMEISVEVFNVFKEKGFVNEDGYLVNDGLVIPWKKAIREMKISLPNKLLVKYIQEELNLAFAYHEMTSLQSERIFDWFESHF